MEPEDYFILNFRLKQLFLNFIVLTLNKNFLTLIQDDEHFGETEYLKQCINGHEFYEEFLRTEGFVRLVSPELWGEYIHFFSILSQAFDQSVIDYEETESMSDVNHSFTFDEHSAFENMIQRQYEFIQKT